MKKQNSFRSALLLSFVLFALLIPTVPYGAESVGKRPYEMDWAGRTVDPVAPLVDFERDEVWTAESSELDVSFARSREQLLWGDYVYRLGYRAKQGQETTDFAVEGKSPMSLVRLRPPKPVAVPSTPFDVLSVWLCGSHWRNGANTELQYVTPSIEAVFLLPDGKEYLFPLLKINWKDWYLVYRPMTPEQQTVLNRPGVCFNGFNVRGGIQSREMAICVDDFALFKEELKPLQFTQRAKRGIDMFPGQDCGANTGEGRLPFPTRPETILPGVKLNDAKNEITTVGKAFRLTYKGSDGSLVVEYRPDSGDWSDLKCRWNDSPFFTPLDKGGIVALADGAKVLQVEKRRFVSAAVEGDAVLSRWEYTAAAIRAEVEYRFRLDGKSLVVDTRCIGGNAANVEFGRVTGIAGVKAIPIPYLSCGAGGTRPCVLLFNPGKSADTSLFIFGMQDWYRSNASRLVPKSGTGANEGRFNGGVEYIPKTDGCRNDVYERFVVTVSPKYDEVLPTIANPKSPWKHVAGKKLWRVHAAFNREQDKEIWYKVWRYGLREVIINDHETGWRDGGEGFTFRTRTAPGKGGDDAQLEYSEYLQKKLGFVYGPYNNFTDFAPVNEFWSPDMVGRTSDNMLQPSWMRCYGPKPLRGVEYCEKLVPIIKNKFKVNTAYCDVHTSVTPWSRTDYDHRVPGAGTFAATYYAYGEIMLLQKRGWNGPVYSEGPNHAFYSGLTDGNYAQDQSYAFMDNPWLVDFDLLRMHDLECNFGMGTLGMFSPGKTRNEKMFYHPHYEGTGDDARDRFVDRYLAATMAFGHIGFLVLDYCFEPAKAFGLAYGPPASLKFENGLPVAFRSYYMNQQLAARYTQESVASIRYCDAEGRQLATSDALKQGVAALNRLVVHYDGGTVICVNGSKTGTMRTTVDGREIVLPPNGYTGWTKDGTIVVESMNRGDGRCDYCDSPAYIYFDSRGGTCSCPKAAGTGIAVCRKLDGGRFEVIPLPGAKTGFAVDAKKAVALDLQCRELGPAKLVRSKGYTFVETVPGAISYRLEP